MTDQKRLDVTQVQHTPYPDHGGNPRAISELTGTSLDQVIDFSASINPLSPPCGVSQLLIETPRLLREYPDPNCTLIKKNISQSTGIPSEWLRITNGSTEMIYLLPHLLGNSKEVAIIDPGFSEYEKAFRASGTQPNSIKLNADNGFQIKPSWLCTQLEMIPDLGAVVLGNPASPTGILYRDILPFLQEYCENRNVVLIVDEAFIDFSSSDNSAWSLLKKSKSLILIRSLTKFYSIPGLRVGYGVLHPEINKQLDSHQYPWSVNALAQAVGAEVVMDKFFQKRTRSWVSNERIFMFKALSSIKEIEVFPSNANFHLFRLRDDSPPGNLYQHLLSNSLLVRNCGNFNGLDESFFRISFRERTENQKLIDSISEYFLSCK
ncbi:MAG: pyridoxal phosphate-dependent class II aminotransferase [Nitrospinae bacterium]|nr:pyridoxal phosphate-dependent class II aminotransferase [Nitrospinota bacterium]